jgi:hypothetical protein
MRCQLPTSNLQRAERQACSRAFAPVTPVAQCLHYIITHFTPEATGRGDSGFHGVQKPCPPCARGRCLQVLCAAACPCPWCTGRLSQLLAAACALLPPALNVRQQSKAMSPLWHKQTLVTAVCCCMSPSLWHRHSAAGCGLRTAVPSHQPQTVFENAELAAGYCLCTAVPCCSSSPPLLNGGHHTPAVHVVLGETGTGLGDICERCL